MSAHNVNFWVPILLVVCYIFFGLYGVYINSRVLLILDGIFLLVSTVLLSPRKD